MKVSIYTDGGSRGNPGNSGFGVVVYDAAKQIIAKTSKYIGIKTNNEAEYLALLEALYWAEANCSKLGITHIDFYSDSQLLVRQIKGVYKVKAPNIKPLHSTATALLDKIQSTFQFHEVLREANTLADELANQAMDRQL